MSEAIQLGTARLPWMSLREAVDDSDSAISVYNAASLPAIGAATDTGQNGTVNLNSPLMKKSNGIFIAGWADGVEDDAVTKYNLHGTAKDGGPLITLLTGAATLGTRACTLHPLTGEALTGNLWFDTITVTGGILSGQVDILDAANNMVCLLQLDTTIFDRIFMEIETIGDPTGVSFICCGW